MNLDAKLLKHLAIFCENVALDIDAHLNTPKSTVIIPSDKLGTTIATLKSMTKEKPKIKTKRKRRDTTRLTVKQCALVKQMRKANPHLFDDQFGERMNQEFGLSKSTTTWRNVVSRNTEYFKSLDY